MFFCLISSMRGRCSYLVNLKKLVIPAQAGIGPGQCERTKFPFLRGPVSPQDDKEKAGMIKKRGGLILN